MNQDESEPIAASVVPSEGHNGGGVDLFGANYWYEQLLVFKALRVGRRVHQSTSRTPPTCGQSMYAIQNNSLFLGLSESVHECTGAPVHLARMDDPRLHGEGGRGAQWASTSASLPKANNITLAPRHLGRSSQRPICAKNAAIHPITLSPVDWKLHSTPF